MPTVLCHNTSIEVAQMEWLPGRKDAAMVELIVTVWNAVPDAVRLLAVDTPAVTVLRLLALMVNGTLYEDMSIGQ